MTTLAGDSLTKLKRYSGNQYMPSSLFVERTNHQRKLERLTLDLEYHYQNRKQRQCSTSPKGRKTTNLLFLERFNEKFVRLDGEISFLSSRPEVFNLLQGASSRSLLSKSEFYMLENGFALLGYEWEITL